MAGGCHCGAVRFRVRLRQVNELTTLYACNCSICAMTGFVHLIVPESDFELLEGQDALHTYTFNTHVAKHLFCRHCGVKSFYRPRSNPDGYSIHAYCLDGGAAWVASDAVDVQPFDGQRWEAHAAALAHLSVADDGGLDS